MDIVLIHENKLKVILTAEDMERLSLDYGRIDLADPGTHDALICILERGREESRFNPRGAKVFIEAFPCEGGGCVLYFTCLHAAPGGRVCMEPVLFEFDTVDDLIRGASMAFQKYRHRICRSLLYLFDGRYRLIVYPLDYSDRLSVYFLSEFGRIVGVGELSAAFTEEHGKEILPEDAMELLSRQFYPESGLS